MKKKRGKSGEGRERIKGHIPAPKKEQREREVRGERKKGGKSVSQILPPNSKKLCPKIYENQTLKFTLMKWRGMLI